MSSTPPPEVPTAVSSSLGHQGRVEGPPGRIRLAPLYQFPTPPRLFPTYERLVDEARAWLLRYVEELGGGQRLERPIDETVSMCSQLFPDADFDGVFLTTIFITLEFVNDDIFDGLDVYDVLLASPRGQRVAEEMRFLRAHPRLLAEGMMAGVRIIRDPAYPAPDLGPQVSGALFFYDALRDFSRRLHEYGRRSGSPHFDFWLGSLCKALVAFSTSHANIYQDIASISVEEYAEHKLINCGMNHTVHFLELSINCFLGERHHQIPLIKELKRHCCHVGSLTNEIFSYEKEVFREKTGNLLLVLMLKEQVDLEEATRRVAALAQRHGDEFLRLRDRAMEEFSEGDEDGRLLRRYVSALEMLTAACWTWQLEGTTRYLSPTSPFAELLLK
jgi:hypothetical protein